MRRRRGVASTEPTSWWDQVVGRRVIIHSKIEGMSSQVGIVREVLTDGVVLGCATLLGEDGPDVPLAGDSWVPMSGIAFAQLPPPEGE